MKPRFQWTDALVAELKSMREAGWSAAQISNALVDAEALMPTRNAVLGKLFRLGMCEVRPEPKPRVARRTQSETSRDNFLGVNIDRAMRRQSVEYVEPDLFSFVCDGVSFADLEPHHCRFPTGFGLDATYCGKTKVFGSYCAAHARICYLPARRDLERLAA